MKIINKKSQAFASSQIPLCLSSFTSAAMEDCLVCESQALSSPGQHWPTEAIPSSGSRWLQLILTIPISLNRPHHILLEYSSAMM